MSNRTPFRVNDLQLVLLEPGGTTRYLKISTVSLSPSSVEIRLDCFVHSNTRAEIDFSGAGRSSIRVEGTIQDCKLVSGRSHSAILRFENTINVDDILKEPEPTPPAPSAAEVRESAHILYIEDHEADRFLMTHRLNKANIRVTVATTVDEGIEAIRQDTFDAVICDFHLEDRTGFDVFEQAVPDLHCGPFFFATSETSPEFRKDSIQRGVDTVIPKPINFPRLIHMLESLRQDPAAGHENTELPSAAQQDEEVSTLYIAMLQHDLAALMESQAKGDAVLTRRICDDILGCAQGYGFDQLGRAAERALCSLDIQTGKCTTESILDELAGLMTRVVSTVANPNTSKSDRPKAA